jgi:folate-dependent phosphoribosylglycinamide formyltransferase PurN
MKNIAIFASGSGTNYEAIMEKIKDGYINNAKVVLMATDHADDARSEQHVGNKCAGGFLALSGTS